MEIYVDADACPVVRIVERVAEEYKIKVCLLCDTNHVLQSDYSEIKIIGAGADAVDFALVNLCRSGDIVVTQDYGVAAMALGKKCICDSSIWKMVYQRQHKSASHGATHCKSRKKSKI